jgi:hypothetical protein
LQNAQVPCRHAIAVAKDAGYLGDRFQSWLELTVDSGYFLVRYAAVLAQASVQLPDRESLVSDAPVFSVDDDDSDGATMGGAGDDGDAGEEDSHPIDGGAGAGAGPAPRPTNTKVNEVVV